MGLFPVISQSKEFIDGYYNDETKVIKNVPVVLFGDHTRVVKYIDVPFIPGADGTKIFAAKCYHKYLFYLIKYASINIEDRGYGRHCALLKSFKVPFFKSEDYQIEISIALDYLFNLLDKIEAEKNSINTLIEKVKLKILNSYFGENSSYKSYYEKFYKLGDVLPYEQPGPFIVESTDYDNNYEIPVLTPGKSFILGYTNERNGIYKVNNKVIIFDDFTTASRLIDFDFKVKSSAMKILHSSDNLMFDIDYMYYKLQTINIMSDTHKRFWISEYSPLKLKIHTINEQKKIVSAITRAFTILDSISKSI